MIYHFALSLEVPSDYQGPRGTLQNDKSKTSYTTPHYYAKYEIYAKKIFWWRIPLSHPRLTNLSINTKDIDGNTPVMLAMKQGDYPVTSLGNRYLEVLAADLRVDLDTTDNEGRSLEEVAVAYGKYYNWCAGANNFHCCLGVAKALQNFIALASLALFVHFISLACCMYCF